MNLATYLGSLLLISYRISVTKVLKQNLTRVFHVHQKFNAKVEYALLARISSLKEGNEGHNHHLQVWWNQKNGLFIKHPATTNLSLEITQYSVFQIFRNFRISPISKNELNHPDTVRTIININSSHKRTKVQGGLKNICRNSPLMMYTFYNSIQNKHKYGTKTTAHAILLFFAYKYIQESITSVPGKNYFYTQKCFDNQ